MAEPTRLLFIARTFPPSVGGMQNLALHLSNSLQQQAAVTMLVNRRGKMALPAFLPYSLAAALYLVRKHRIQAIHLADAILAPIGVALKRLTKRPVTVTVHGLDVTFPNRFYQSVIPRAIAGLDLVLPNSTATEAVVRQYVGDDMPTQVVPLGVNPLPEPSEAAVAEFRMRADLVGDADILLTVGRLIKRKGVTWLVEHVLPRLPQNVVYVVIGEGGEETAIREGAARAGVTDRVRLLGRVSDEVLAAAYRESDLFVMPNVQVPGDIEGFGLVALEAVASGLPVVASQLEGITEAIKHDANGLLVASGAPEEYTLVLRRTLAMPRNERRQMGERFRVYTEKTFGWDQTARRYLDEIDRVVNKAA